MKEQRAAGPECASNSVDAASGEINIAQFGGLMENPRKALDVDGARCTSVSVGAARPPDEINDISKDAVGSASMTQFGNLMENPRVALDVENGAPLCGEP